jgi:hypothetical protein
MRTSEQPRRFSVTIRGRLLIKAAFIIIAGLLTLMPDGTFQSASVKFRKLDGRKLKAPASNGLRSE